MKMTELTVLRDDVEWKTRLDGKISEVEIDGRKISDVHDLTQKVISMTKTIKVLAVTALTLCIIAVGMAIFVTQWLLANESSIQRLLLTSSKDYTMHMVSKEKWNSHQRHRAYIHLEEFHGLHWDEGMQDWVNHAMVDYPKKRSGRGGS